MISRKNPSSRKIHKFPHCAFNVPAIERPRPLSARMKCMVNSVGMVCMAKVVLSLDGVEDTGRPSGKCSLEP